MPRASGNNPCVERVTHSKITVSEKGKSLTIINDSRDEYDLVNVDGCLVKDGPRADWIISKPDDVSAVVELKGRDVGHAVDQIFATLSNPRCENYLAGNVKLVIVCAKYPSFDTKVAKAQVRAKKSGASLKVICRALECRIGEL